MTRFEFSDKGKHEYCCTFVKLGKIVPIKNSDFLGTTLVNGLSIVVRKDECKEGDVMIYASNESELNKEFLKCNNLFNEPELNQDPTKKGLFNKFGRIKLVCLRGTYSYGFLFKPSDLLKWKPELDLSNIEIDKDFDTIDGELFIKAYIPKTSVKSSKSEGRAFDTSISFHYDTEQLAGRIDKIDPNKVINVSVKLHGTSAVFANVPITIPLKLNIFQRFFTRKPKILTKFDLVCASRREIKAEEDSLWNIVGEKIKDYIPQGYTIYGEIIGYSAGLDRYIQKDYDYSCSPGEWKFMIYRINSTSYHGFIPGSSYEWEADEVRDWTLKLKKEHPELNDYLMELPVLYQGTLKSRYKTTNSSVILSKMKKDFGLEKIEPLCKNKVPREGIILRVKGDPIKEAFKLKSDKFMARESEQIDNGEIDMELVEGGN